MNIFENRLTNNSSSRSRNLLWTLVFKCYEKLPGKKDLNLGYLIFKPISNILQVKYFKSNKLKSNVLLNWV